MAALSSNPAYLHQLMRYVERSAGAKQHTPPLAFYLDWKASLGPGAGEGAAAPGNLEAAEEARRLYRTYVDSRRAHGNLVRCLPKRLKAELDAQIKRLTIELSKHQADAEHGAYDIDAEAIKASLQQAADLCLRTIERDSVPGFLISPHYQVPACPPRIHVHPPSPDTSPDISPDTPLESSFPPPAPRHPMRLPREASGGRRPPPHTHLSTWRSCTPPSWSSSSIV